jgi:hypothetical protein
MILTTVFLLAIMLAPALSTVQACSWNYKPKPKPSVEFVFHIANVMRVDDNVRWWTNTGESGTGTPPTTPPEGATKLVAKGHQFVLLGEEPIFSLVIRRFPYHLKTTSVRMM